MNNYYDNLDIEKEFDLVPSEDELSSENIYEENLNFSSLHNILQPREFKFIIENNGCENESCKNTINEINKLKEECSNLEKKYMLIDRTHSQQIQELTEKSNDLTRKIYLMSSKIQNYEGEGLSELSYYKLNRLEMSLLKLLANMRMKISKIEMSQINGIKTENKRICKSCNKSKINCIIRPCNHLSLCYECVQKSLKCPICFNFIEYYDRFYIPNN
jgi:hypothetical protein